MRQISNILLMPFWCFNLLYHAIVPKTWFWMFDPANKPRLYIYICHKWQQQESLQNWLCLFSLASSLFFLFSWSQGKTPLLIKELRVFLFILVCLHQGFSSTLLAIYGAACVVGFPDIHTCSCFSSWFFLICFCRSCRAHISCNYLPS